MIRFRTELTLPPSDSLLDIDRPLTLIGSCFTDAIGERMTRSGWDVTANPCGTLFNPASIARCISIAAGDEPLPSPFEARGAYFHWQLPTKFGGKTPEEAMSKAAAAFAMLREGIIRSQALIVTLGTAWIYSLRDSGETVANCHKMPQQIFIRRRMETDEITDIWTATARKLRKLNPDIRILLTVSPVRHLKDGFNGNALSKSTLLLACEKICLATGAEYFPAFEAITDDLRDYRFYASDLVHPSETAADYVWQLFCSRYISESHRARLNLTEKESRRAAHRPIIGI